MIYLTGDNMIHSISTYLKTTITNYLKAFLSDRYILNEEILGDFPEDISNSFIHTYCTDHRLKDKLAKPVDVRFTFNPKKLSSDTTILIQEKGGKERTQSDQSIGMNMGTTNKKNGNIYKELSLPHYDPKKELAYYQLNHKINKVFGIDRYSGKYRIINNRIYLLSPIAANLAKRDDNPAEKTTITYDSINPSRNNKNKHNKYYLIGYDATEDYTIDIISNNVDNIRCFCALLKGVFIAMRIQAKRENTIYHLPKISEQGVDQLSTLTDQNHSTFGNKYYYHRFVLNYLVTYTLPEKVGFYINKFITSSKYNNYLSNQKD